MKEHIDCSGLDERGILRSPKRRRPKSKEEICQFSSIRLDVRFLF